MYILGIYLKSSINVRGRKRYSLKVCEDCAKNINTYKLMFGWENGKCEICNKKYYSKVQSQWQYWFQLSNAEKREIVKERVDCDDEQLQKMHWRKLPEDHPLVRLNNPRWQGRSVTSIPRYLRNKINYNVSPIDVRKNIRIYQHNVVVWAGVILQGDFSENSGISLLVDHRSIWGGDIGIRPVKIFLKSRGLGLFKTTCTLKTNCNLERAKELTKPGKLCIVYGIPQKIDRFNIITLTCKNVDFSEKPSDELKILE